MHGEQQVDLRSARVRAKGGEVTARGRLALTGNKAFSAEGNVARFDPSAFGDFPSGSLNGNFTATGALAPQWAARVNVTLAEPSKFRGAPLAGGARFDVSEQRIADADVALRLGANRLNAKGNFGNAGDRLTWNIDVTDPAVIDPRLGGTLAAEGVVEGTPAQPAGRFTVACKALHWAKEISIAELGGSGEVARGLDGDIRLALQARDVKRGTQKIDKASVNASGTLARHDIQLAAAGPAFDASAALSGAWSNGSWTGHVTSLENRGEQPVKLLEPATVEIDSGSFALGAARLRLGDGMVNIAGVRSAGGTLETRGEFSGIAVAYLLRPSPNADAIEATLKFGGRWNLRADQNLNCSVEVARESGDILLPTAACDGARPEQVPAWCAVRR